MDIFNRNKVRELEKEVETYKKFNDKLKEKFAKIEKIVSNTPDTCVRGPWCDACIYDKKYSYTFYVGNGNFKRITSHACIKGISCKEFILKEKSERNAD